MSSQPKRPDPFGGATMVSAKEIAAYLGVSPKHVRRLASGGTFPQFVKVGRLCRWPRDEVMRWLEAQSGR